MGTTINFSLSVNPAVTPPTPLTLEDGNGNPLTNGESVTLTAETVGVADPGQVLFKVSGGTPPYNYEVASGSIPAGDTVAAAVNPDGSETVTLAGTPSVAGASTFAVNVADSSIPVQAVTATVKRQIKPKASGEVL